MKAERYRAYEAVQVYDVPQGQEEDPELRALHRRRKSDISAKGLETVDASGDVFKFGDVPESGTVRFDAGDTKIRRVAFYGGDVEAEVCLGSIEVNTAGKIVVDAADAK